MGINKNNSNVFLILMVVFVSGSLIGQDLKRPEEGELGVVEIFRSGHPLSLPFVKLSGERPIELRFDVFGFEDEVFYYKVELYDFDWQAVQIDPFEYLEGFEENSLQSYASSINTTTNYMHYRLELPNDDIDILLPGNYMVHVCSENYEDTLLSRKFVVYEEKVKLEMWKKEYESERYEDRQELGARVIPTKASFFDLSGNIKLGVFQNNNWNNIQVLEKYNADGKGNIVFDHPGLIVFSATNEFRYIDIKSLKFISERVEFFNYEPITGYHIYLKEDKCRGDKQYFYNEDLAGKFFISNQETNDPDTLDAEYMFVHFKLGTGIPLPSDIYIEGALTDWGMDDNYMVFRPETGYYEKVLFLKQGLYNYRYVSMEYDTKTVDWFITEGNFQETKNNYVGIVYYRPMGGRYYRPSGISVLNTE